jgi:hypothetical protein
MILFFLLTEMVVFLLTKKVISALDNRLIHHIFKGLTTSTILLIFNLPSQNMKVRRPIFLPKLIMLDLYYTNRF